MRFQRNPCLTVLRRPVAGAARAQFCESPARPGGARPSRDRKGAVFEILHYVCLRLHGDESGSVDRRHNLVGSRLLEPDAERVMWERRAMLRYPYLLDEAGAAHVRSNSPVR